MNATKRRYGNVGLLAEAVFRNFELILMLIAGLVIGGLMTTVVSLGSGFAAGIWLASATAVCIGLTIVAVELFHPDY